MRKHQFLLSPPHNLEEIRGKNESFKVALCQYSSKVRRFVERQKDIVSLISNTERSNAGYSWS